MQIINIVLKNFIMTTVFIIFLVLAVLVNTWLGQAEAKSNKMYDKNKLVSGLKGNLNILAGLYGLIFLISTFPQVLEYYNINVNIQGVNLLSSEAVDAFSVTAIVVPITAITALYISLGIKKILHFLNILKKKIKDEEETLKSPQVITK